MRVDRHIFVLSIFLVAAVLVIGCLLTVCPHVDAQEDDGDGDIFLPLVVKNHDPTWQWRAPITVTLTPQTSSAPLMALDHQGRPHILWDTYKEPKFVYHTYLDSGTWVTPTAVAESLGFSEALYPPVVDSQGGLHLLWLNRETYNDPYRTLYTRFTSGQWAAEEEVFRSSQTGSALLGMVHFDEKGNIHATMVDGFLVSGIYHTVHAETGWEASVEIEPPTHYDWVWPDHRGGVHFYGNDYGTPSYLYYSYWREGHFTVRDRRGPARVDLAGRETQLDGKGNLHIFWTDPVAIPGGSVTGVYHQCLGEDLSAGPKEVLSGESYASGVVKTGSRTRRFALAWQEEGGERVRMGVWEGCRQTDTKTVPFSGEMDWTPRAMAISDVSSRVCILGYTTTYYPHRYEVVCADILR
jgi:hypothetical protein